jgi:hypothetical protein
MSFLVGFLNRALERFFHRRIRHGETSCLFLGGDPRNSDFDRSPELSDFYFLGGETAYFDGCDWTIKQSWEKSMRVEDRAGLLLFYQTPRK